MSLHLTTLEVMHDQLRRRRTYAEVIVAILQSFGSTQKLLRAGDALDDDFDLSDEGGSGSGEEGSDDEEDEDEEQQGGVSALQARRMRRAAGNDPLQQQFRATAAALLAKHGLGRGQGAAGGDDEDADEEDAEGGGEDGSDEDEEDVSGGEDGAAEEGDSEGGEEGAADGADVGGGLEGEHDDIGEGRRQQPAAVAEAWERKASGRAASASGRRHAGEPDQAELPYAIVAPGGYEEFAALVRGRSAEELGEAVRRIRACNAAALGGDNRRKLQARCSPCHLSSLLLSGGPGLPRVRMDVPGWM